MPLADLINNAKPAATPATPNTAAPAAAPAQGGSRLAKLQEQLRTTSVSGGGVKNIPGGEGWYLLKEAKFQVTERSHKRLTEYRFICLNAIKDKNNILPGESGYSGPEKGEEYRAAIWHDNDFTVKNYLTALRCCMGWTAEQLKGLQADDAGSQQIFELVPALTCLGLDDKPTGQPCIFANQVVLKMVGKTTIRTMKDAQGNPVYDAQGKEKQESFDNIYWDSKISIADVVQNVDEAFLLKAFGGEEAVKAALDTEARLASILE